MITKAMKVFGSSKSTGSIALIIEHDNFNLDDRQNFATNQNYAACVFIEQNDDHIVLDYYYPDRRSPLCIHATLGAGYVYFNNHPKTKELAVITAMHKQKMLLENHSDGIFLRVTPEPTKHISIDNKFIGKLLNLNSLVIKHAIASVGSPKLLIEVDSAQTLNNLSPNLELISSFSHDNHISGCYVYCKISDSSYLGRNFNHSIPEREDIATGVAAGALSAFLKKDIDVFQGNNLNNPCVIHTKYSNDNILIGGNVTPL